MNKIKIRVTDPDTCNQITAIFICFNDLQWHSFEINICVTSKWSSFTVPVILKSSKWTSLNEAILSKKSLIRERKKCTTRVKLEHEKFEWKQCVKVASSHRVKTVTINSRKKLNFNIPTYSEMLTFFHFTNNEREYHYKTVLLNKHRLGILQLCSSE